ncbi:MAG: hypothetical protein ABFD50_02290 [Smithella sp.]
MKHGFPESPTELCEFRTKKFKSAIKALKKCLILFNDSQIASLIYAAFEYLNIAELLVDHANEMTLRSAEIEKENAQCELQDIKE